MSPPSDAAEAPVPVVAAPLTARRRRRRVRRPCRLAVGTAVLLGVLSPAIYSYTTTMLQPSSLPLGVRSVEWLRTHHGNWLVDDVERVYFITYQHGHGLVPTKIVPNVMQPATRYLVPDDRDFFAVYRRLPGPVSVPFN